MNELTVSVWVKRDVIDNNIYWVVGKSTEPFTFNSGTYDIYLRDDVVHGRLYVQGIVGCDFGGTYPTDTTDFHNIVLRYKGGLMSLYVDGVFNSDCGPWTPNPINDSSHAVHFASQPDPTARFLPGDIDEVRIYERGLTETEIQALFQMGT
jgi:hypothetical protein